MKKLMMMMATVALMMNLAACGDDKDEPQVQVKNGIIASVFTNENDTHYEFKLDEETNTGDITAFNVVFTIGETQSPAMTIRIPKAKFTRKNNTITFDDTDIAPDMLRGTSWVPMPGEQYKVTNLKSVLNLETKTFNIAFNCHGGSFSDNGSIIFNE